jgi:drug/metabolite transporter (DMT)-like permease
VKGLALAAITAANLIGGSTYLAQEEALRGLPPATITLLRNLLALACLAGWGLSTGGLRLRFRAREHGRLLLLGTTAYAAPLLLGIVGVSWSTSGNASILILLEPVSIVLFSWLLLHEHVRRAQLAGLTLGLLGALVIVLEGADPADLLAGTLLAGNLVLALHGILWGLYSPLMAPLVQRHRSIDVTFMSMVWALALLLPASLLEHDAWTPGPRLAPALAWTAGLGLLASFGGTVLWVWSLRSLSPATVAPFVFLQPVAGVVADYLAHDRVPSSQVLAGGAVIAAGVLLAMLPMTRRPALKGEGPDGARARPFGPEQNR